MAQGADEWWVSREGQRIGPVSFEQMVEAAKAGRLEPRTDLVYGGQLEDWVAAGEIEGLFERKKPKKEEPASDHGAPDDSLADSGSYDFGDRPAKIDQPGATRLGYILGMLFLPGVVAAGLLFVVPQVGAMLPESLAPFAPVLFLLVPLIAIMITVKRFQNLAMSGAWVLGLLVPLLNLWLNYRLFAAPPGYGFTGKLDGIGKFLAVIYWLFVIASLVLPVVFLPATLAHLNESGQLEEFVEQLEQFKARLPAPAAEE